MFFFLECKGNSVNIIMALKLIVKRAHKQVQFCIEIIYHKYGTPCTFESFGWKFNLNIILFNKKT